MKLKKTKVQNFTHQDDFGEFQFKDIEILFNPLIREISSEDFNQEEDEYLLSDETISKLSIDTSARFFNQRHKEILSQKKPLTTRELKGIKIFLGVSGSDLGELIGMDKSSVSRVLSAKQSIKHDMAMLIMERLKDEIQSPGYNKILLKNLHNETNTHQTKELGIDIFQLAEYLIRFFENNESPISNLKLQKLVYYAQGIALGRYSVKLFNDPILAWAHGPVVRALYDRYRSSNAHPVQSDKSLLIDDITNNELVKKILDETISLYGVYDAWALRNKTHNESPWLETNKDEVITDEKIISYFRKQIV